MRVVRSFIGVSDVFLTKSEVRTQFNISKDLLEKLESSGFIVPEAGEVDQSARYRLCDVAQGLAKYHTQADYSQRPSPEPEFRTKKEWVKWFTTLFKKYDELPANALAMITVSELFPQLQIALESKKVIRFMGIGTLRKKTYNPRKYRDLTTHQLRDVGERERIVFAPFSKGQDKNGHSED